MSNTLTAYPTDLTTPCRILLTRFNGGTPAPVNEQVHAAYQVLGVAASHLYPDGASPTPAKDIWDRPDGMKAAARPCDADCKAALEEGAKMRGGILDWLKTPAGRRLVQAVVSILTTLMPQEACQ